MIDFLFDFTTIVISSTQATTLELTTTTGPQNDSKPAKTPGNTRDPYSTDTKGLSTLVIVVIAVGGSLPAVIIGVAVPCYIRRRRRNKRF